MTEIQHRMEAKVKDHPIMKYGMISTLYGSKLIGWRDEKYD